MRYYREHPDEPINHDWFAGAIRYSEPEMDQLQAQEPLINYGYMIWCDCGHYYEPEGTIWFNHEPRIGESVRLGDGKDWRITKVNPNNLEAWTTLNEPDAHGPGDPVEYGRLNYEQILQQQIS